MGTKAHTVCPGRTILPLVRCVDREMASENRTEAGTRRRSVSSSLRHRHLVCAAD